jgi:hypothetical protein
MSVVCCTANINVRTRTMKVHLNGPSDFPHTLRVAELNLAWRKENRYLHPPTGEHWSGACGVAGQINSRRVPLCPPNVTFSFVHPSNCNMKLKYVNRKSSVSCPDSRCWYCSWIFAPCGCRQCFRRFGATCYFHLHARNVHIYSKPSLMRI